jgi:hypothetical protein
VNGEKLFGLAVAAVVVTGTAGLLLLRALPEQPARPVAVQVVSFHAVWSRCVQKTAIVFRTEDGRTGEDWRQSAQMDCRVGDWIGGEAVGASLRLAAASCRKRDPVIGSRAC